MFSATLGSLTWQEIDTISQSGKAQSVFSIGDSKSLSCEAGSLTAKIIGFNHDNLQSGGKAGITFFTSPSKDWHKMCGPNNETKNVVIYANTWMNTWLNIDVLQSCPADFQNAVKTTIKSSALASTSSSRNDPMKLFLLSFNEVNIYSSQAPGVSNSEGNAYAAFTDYRSRNFGKRWWLRSSQGTPNPAGWGMIETDGDIPEVGDDQRPWWSETNENVYVCFGFCV